MNTTTTYRIQSTASGLDIGDYQAVSPAAALDAMARNAGYQDSEDACEQTGDDGSHLVVTPIDIISI